MSRNFRELKIWQTAVDLVCNIYKETDSFPSNERFGITNQMRRASVSIPSNISEGCGRGTNAQLIHFLDIAQGSAFELETQTIISQRLGFLCQQNADGLLETINFLQRSISNFKKTLE